jgi:DNA-binding beta-propeller fold protein YncE
MRSKTERLRLKSRFTTGKAPLCVVSEGVGGPEGIALDGNGNVYVSNSRLNNITVYSQATCAYIRTIT